MNLKNFPKIRVVDRTLSMLQDNVVTWTNTLIANFSNLFPNKVVVTDAQNNIKTSDITTDELNTLSGIDTTETIQTQLDNIIAAPQNIVIGSASGVVHVTTTPPVWTTVTGLSVTFITTVVNQPILLSVVMSGFNMTGTDVCFTGYTINGGAVQPAASSFLTTGQYTNLSFTKPIPIATPGSTTIQIVAGKSAANYDIAYDAYNVATVSVLY